VAIQAGEYDKAANIKALMKGTKGGMKGMDYAMMLGIPAAMTGVAGYTEKTNREAEQEEQDKLMAGLKGETEKWRTKFNTEAGVPITQEDFLYPDYYTAAKGGRIGYALGEGVQTEKGSIEGHRAGPDWFTLRVQDLMQFEGLSYEEASEQAYEEGPGGGAMAQGGRIGYYGGGIGSLEAGAPNIKYEGDMRAIEGQQASTMSTSMIELISYLETLPFDKKLRALEMLPPEIRAEVEARLGLAQGGRIGAQEGGLMNLGGMEKDYRQEGGFVPIGGEEKADDVPARLSKNEFVFTADAVRAAGGGDIDQGAEVMENLMENLEAGGKVSEESQGLEGAREMFANAQELQKRII
jgi:hypothetical protein